jgi:hypothetical protein
MAKDPTTNPEPLKDKMILLAQLKRYDEKIKQKIENSASSGTIQATGIAPLNLSVESLTDGGSKIKGSLNIGPGLRVEAQHGLLMPSVDNETIEVSTGQIRVKKRNKKNIEVSNQPSAGSVTAQYNPGTVCIHFDNAWVTGNSKTLVGKIPSVYAPSTAVVGSVVSPGSSWIMSAYSKVEPDGSIYVNPFYSNAADLGWTGTLTYLI